MRYMAFCAFEIGMALLCWKLCRDSFINFSSMILIRWNRSNQCQISSLSELRRTSLLGTNSDPKQINVNPQYYIVSSQNQQNYLSVMLRVSKSGYKPDIFSPCEVIGASSYLCVFNTYSYLRSLFCLGLKPQTLGHATRALHGERRIQDYQH